MKPAKNCNKIIVEGNYMNMDINGGNLYLEDSKGILYRFDISEDLKLGLLNIKPNQLIHRNDTKVTKISQYNSLGLHVLEEIWFDYDSVFLYKIDSLGFYRYQLSDREGNSNRPFHEKTEVIKSDWFVHLQRHNKGFYVCDREGTYKFEIKYALNWSLTKIIPERSFSIFDHKDRTIFCLGNNKFAELGIRDDYVNYREGFILPYKDRFLISIEQGKYCLSDTTTLDQFGVTWEPFEINNPIVEEAIRNTDCFLQTPFGFVFDGPGEIVITDNELNLLMDPIKDVMFKTFDPNSYYANYIAIIYEDRIEILNLSKKQ